MTTTTPTVTGRTPAGRTTTGAAAPASTEA
jgi:hypothetical protein